MINDGNHRIRFWLHALIVGVVLTGQVHLYTAEILHHHDEDTVICKIAHDGGTYLHAAPGMTPVCPLCQVFRNSSVRPSVNSILPQAEGESSYQVVNREAAYSSSFAPSLQARAPPLS
jgi:hypothetical protein